MPRRAERLTGLGTSVFTEMTALAQRTRAINLGQGLPDVDGPAEAIEATGGTASRVLLLNSPHNRPGGCWTAPSFRRFAEVLRGRHPAAARRRGGTAPAGLEPLVPAGTYFVDADIGIDAVAFCAELPARAGVVGILTSVFYDDRAAAATLCASPSASGRR